MSRHHRFDDQEEHRGGTPAATLRADELRGAAYRVCEAVRALEPVWAEFAASRAKLFDATLEDLRDANTRLSTVLYAAQRGGAR